MEGARHRKEGTDAVEADTEGMKAGAIGERDTEKIVDPQEQTATQSKSRGRKDNKPRGTGEKKSRNENQGEEQHMNKTGHKNPCKTRRGTE